ncbi:S-Ena type endospore appendage [Bacillus sp. JCM 19034]|uniref:S-Ena type endospore appendage n=1 Tax=Bacillus sp. JCM 19034 TaxID=1481928 RepID=UPI0007859950|nr:S-Ena type endospore appendage [Bacillus sp. JCM 19034]
MTRNSNKPHSHCIRAEKVYDWTQTMIEMKKFINIPSELGKKAKDDICIPFKVKGNVQLPTVIWQAINIVSTVSFTIHYSPDCKCDLIILIDQQKLTTLAPGQNYIATVSHINQISILCEGKNVENVICCGELTITVNYNMIDIGAFKDIKSTYCFLSNKDGKPFNLRDKNAIVYEEIKNKLGRKTINVSTDIGQKIKLQEVRIRFKFFITVELLDSTGICCYSCTYPIDQMKTVLLCAPNKTIIKSVIYDFYCDSTINMNTEKHLEICNYIQLYQDLKVIYETTINIEGRLCNPNKYYDVEKK